MPLKHIFLTGEPGIGKTTAIRAIATELQRRGTKVGGVVSGEIRNAGVRVGFQIEDISTHMVGVLARRNEEKNKSTVSRYVVNLADLAGVGASAVEHAIANADLIIVDEIGPMELQSPEFILAIENALRSTKTVLATIHKRSSHPLVSSIRAKYQIIELTRTNREHVVSEIVRKLAQ
jgi:nucleoside-triphosphatase